MGRLNLCRRHILLGNEDNPLPLKMHFPTLLLGRILRVPERQDLQEDHRRRLWRVLGPRLRNLYEEENKKRRKKRQNRKQKKVFKKRGISIASMVFLPTHPSSWSYIKLPFRYRFCYPPRSQAPLPLTQNERHFLLGPPSNHCKRTTPPIELFSK